MRALLAQLKPQPGDVAANVARAAAIVRAHAGADLVAFPELYVTGYDLDTVAGHAIDADGPELAPLRAAAASAGTAVAIGFAQRWGPRVANAVAAIAADGSVVAVARKTHLFGDEADVFAPGDALVVAPLAGRSVGLLVCFDMEFPEPARALVLAGADVLLTVAANMEPYEADHRLAGRARALDNRCPHLYVNRWGTEAGVRFVGGTRFVGSGGTVVEEAGPGEGLVDVMVGARETGDDRVDYLAHRREDLSVLVPTSAARGDRSP